MKPRYLFLILLTFFLPACSLLVSTAPQPTAVPQAVSETPTPTQIACPQPAADEVLYGGPNLGFCFLYPSSFYIYPSKAIILRTLPPSSGSDTVGGTMTITYEDLAGRSLQAYADEIIAQNAGSSAYKSAITLDSGYPAILIDGFAGPPPWRAILIEHNGLAYLVSFQPWDNSLPDVKASLEQIYMSVISSWVFTR